MNKIFALFLLIGIGFLNAQSADEIIDKHLEVTGGIEAWNNLNSIIIDGQVSIDVSDVVHIKIEHARPYFKRVSYIVDGKEMLSEGFDGEQAYTYNELDGNYKKLANYQKDAFETDILNYKKKGFKVSLVGKEKLNSKDVFKVKLTKNTVENYYWFDAKSYQLLKEQNELETVNYSDFKKVGKLSFAHRMEATPVGGKEYVVIFEKIIPNAAIPAERFIFN
ncbi:hypothetical protein NMK71_09620 [Weeksellaceae bacterium KMM 9713]|uniref:Outer membrane lipoprotein-sorting protein n=1 Tax=Profundicola chukchiensis TaxID=2961959 RepID=A0A9X4N463_9FLAO|nr:hypothetical protein [Profundicola chukchiensis]MDG4946674.1 hypothetical protein [Profundicola chukchiensis]